MREEEYRRAYGGDIGELIYPSRVVEQFVERLERAVNRNKTSGATVVVDFCGGVAGLVASRVFSRLGVSAVVMEGFANANAVGEAGGMNLEESIERVARIVPTVDAAFGAVVSPEAEYVQFVDDEESGCRPTSCSPASLTSCARRAPCSPSTSAVGTRDSLSRATAPSR